MFDRPQFTQAHNKNAMLHWPHSIVGIFTAYSAVPAHMVLKTLGWEWSRERKVNRDTKTASWWL